MEQHKLTYWLYNHFFHFFDIPHFIPKDLLKKFLEHWNEFFCSRDELNEIIEDKDSLLDSLSSDPIVRELNRIIQQKRTAWNEFLDIYENLFDIYEKLGKNGNDLFEVLENILGWQKNYDWLT